ncbi:MAG: RluA family pseudouridine synthase [Lachnospiraceae bacterium]|nr:RluA family pseudouridine synthase [Lachnospiraceae bacterium]
MERRYTEIIAGPEEAGREVGSLLRGLLGFSAARIRSVKFDPEGLMVVGERVTVRHKMREGEVLRVLLEDSSLREQKLLPYDVPLEVLYEDADVICVNKPTGMVCHPSIGHYADTLANALAARFAAAGSGAVHLAGRLDKETSGVVLCAKNGAASDRLKAQRASGKMEKTYLALVRGDLSAGQTGEIRLPLKDVREGPSGHVLSRPAEEGEGRSAVTSYEVTACGGGISAVKVRIATGRMHQIRAHFAAVGHPLCGDRVYGEEEDPALSRTALHAAQLRFFQPFTGEEIRVRAPLPEDMRERLRAAWIDAADI